jgi:hypothetical protein
MKQEQTLNMSEDQMQSTRNQGLPCCVDTTLLSNAYERKIKQSYQKHNSSNQKKNIPDVQTIQSITSYERYCSFVVNELEKKIVEYLQDCSKRTNKQYKLFSDNEHIFATLGKKRPCIKNKREEPIIGQTVPAYLTPVTRHTFFVNTLPNYSHELMQLTLAKKYSQACDVNVAQFHMDKSTAVECDISDLLLDEPTNDRVEFDTELVENITREVFEKYRIPLIYCRS